MANLVSKQNGNIVEKSSWNRNAAQLELKHKHGDFEVCEKSWQTCFLTTSTNTWFLGKIMGMYLFWWNQAKLAFLARSWVCTSFGGIMAKLTFGTNHGKIIFEHNRDKIEIRQNRQEKGHPIQKVGIWTTRPDNGKMDIQSNRQGKAVHTVGGMGVSVSFAAAAWALAKTRWSVACFLLLVMFVVVAVASCLAFFFFWAFLVFFFVPAVCFVAVVCFTLFLREGPYKGGRQSPGQWGERPAGLCGLLCCCGLLCLFS